MKKTIVIIFLFLSSFAQAEETTLFAKLQLEAISQNMSTINPRFNLISDAELSIDENSIELILSKRMPTCPIGSFCPQIMPSPVTVNLSLIDVIQTPCSTQYIGATPDDVSSRLYEEVIVEDFSGKNCEKSEKSGRAPGVIKYKVTGPSSMTQQQDTAGATFSVDGSFSRPIVQP